MNQGNLPFAAEEMRTLGLNTPGGPDVLLANGTVTSHDSVARSLLREFVMRQGAFPGKTIEQLDGIRYHEIDTVAELDAKWPVIRASRPDFIKTYLRFTDGTSQGSMPPFLRGKSLAPDIFRAIVSRAHKDGLRVSAHVVRAADLRLALDAGADMIAHIPEQAMTEDDARAVARRGIPIATTLAFRVPFSPPPKMAAMVANLRMLVAAGANVVIGADRPADSSAGEAAYLQTTGVWTNAELLRCWSVTTPRAIFPERRIGRFDEGYEASFLALDGDPLTDWTATGRIRHRFKQGVVMETGASAVSALRATATRL